MHTLNSVRMSMLMLISYEKSNQKFFFSLSTAYSRSHALAFSCLCARICLVIISKLIIWYLLRFYLWFFSPSLARSLALSSSVRHSICAYLFFSTSPIHLWIRDCRCYCCIENLKTISCWLLLLLLLLQ